MNILFLGDSITDCGHCFTADNLGNGYVKYISRSLQKMKPSAPFIINGGTDGFTFPLTLRKWQQNYQTASWDVAVITGGINEVGYIMNTNLSGQQARQYLEQSMDALRRLTASLLRHNTRVILFEPFLFPVPDYRTLWLPCLKEVLMLIRKTLGEFSSGPAGAAGQIDPIQLLSAQPALDELVQKRGYAAVTTDGIHLTDAGNHCLAKLLLPALMALPHRL